MAGCDLLFNGEQYLESLLWVVLSRPVSTPTDCADWTNGMEAGTRYCWTYVDVLFAHPLRLDDRKGQLCDRGSAVFCHFRCFARWVRLERDLYKTPIYRCCCDGIRHFFDCQSVVHQQAGCFCIVAIDAQPKETPNLTLRSG